MEGFVTRSALDKDMNFTLDAVEVRFSQKPIMSPSIRHCVDLCHCSLVCVCVQEGLHVRWPISVRRNRFSTATSPTSEHEPSVMRSDVEGEMDPELLLSYSLERINLPRDRKRVV